MAWVIVGVQIATPALLLAWLAFWPAASVIGFVLQAAGVGAFLLGLALVSQWAVPAWWLPWAYGAVWMTIVALRSVGVARAAQALPSSAWGWIAAVVSFALLGVGAWYAIRALGGRTLPSVQVVDVANPFGPGLYMVGHGGSNELVNGHLRTLDPTVERYRAWRGQSYAVDFFGIGQWGLRASGWRPADPEAYAIFGAGLRAPCDGTIVVAEGGMPDFEVPQEDPVNRLGNHVVVRCGDAEILLAHMRGGSIGVDVGDTVHVGDRLGEVGNSGASTEPHLHIHAQRPAPPGEPIVSGDPLALRIDGRFLVRNQLLAGE